jgi:hypothetical protein
VDEKLDELSLKAFIEISNTFTHWWATPESRLWKIEVDHCTYRQFEFEIKGNSLSDIISQALEQIRAFEKEQDHIARSMYELGVGFRN